MGDEGLDEVDCCCVDDAGDEAFSYAEAPGTGYVVEVDDVAELPPLFEEPFGDWMEAGDSGRTELVEFPTVEPAPVAWNEVSDAQWGQMSDADRITAFLGAPLTPTAPAVMPMNPFGPSLTDVVDQLGDINRTWLAPTGLTADHVDGRSVWEDSGGFQSSNLNDFRKDENGRYHS